MSTPREIQPLWEWTLGRYRRQGVAPLCLQLQDRYGADINLLFLALWLAANGRTLGPKDDPASEIEAWHKRIVIPLRSARRAMKGWPMLEGGPSNEDRDVVRAKLQAIEIETERLELGFLANWAMRAELAPTALDGDLINLRQILPAAAEDADLARLAELTR